LDYLIITIKNWPNIVQVGCDGAIYETYDIWSHYDWWTL
jgi:hypothetical protein